MNLRAVARGLSFRALAIAGATLLGSGSARSDEHVHALGVSVGPGVAFPMPESTGGHDVRGTGTGAWLEAEYIYRAVEWITPRAYAGLAAFFPDNDCGPMVSRCDVSARIVFVGGKLRLLLPLFPNVAPFSEVGLGLSAGSMATRSGGLVDVRESGVMFHIPVGAGLEIGARHKYELAFQALVHSRQRQFDVALVLGMTFPLR